MTLFAKHLTMAWGRHAALLVCLNGVLNSCAPDSSALFPSLQNNLAQNLTRLNAPRITWPDVPVPADNPLTQAKVELGLRLFFEPRLSSRNTLSCATCHQPGKGFSNGEPTAAGVDGIRGGRNTPTIYTTGHHKTLFWDGRAATLEEQALGPIQNPIEMNESLANVIRKLGEIPYYPQKFRQAFGTEITAAGMAQALASFERALALSPSPYDRFQNGEDTALNESQKRGLELFSRRAHCMTCHKGTSFTDSKFHNLGVGIQQANPDVGRFQVTQQPEDWGAFKTPPLRNIAQSGPYMHDGSLKTLEAVVDYYDRGGNDNPHLDREMRPLNLTPTDKQDLVNFMRVLSSRDNLKELSQLPGVRLANEKITLPGFSF